MKKPSEMPLSTAQLRSVRRAVEETDTPLQRWQTVRDAIGDLPNPADEHGVGAYYNHEFRDGARIYAGHSGSQMDEPSKTIKAGAHGVPGGENMVVLDDGSVRYYTCLLYTSTMSVLEKICAVLDADFGDIVEYVKDAK